MTALERSVSPPRRRRWFVIGVVAWLVIASTAMGLLARYKLEPGHGASTRARWPSSTALVRAADRPTLILFAHPGCPCTRASLTELRDVASRVRDRVAIVVAAVDAGDAGELREDVADIPGATYVVDRDGAEAARFGARTSGHVVLYTPDGSLRFAGGITNSRGHVGDGPAKRRLLSAIAVHTARATSPSPPPSRVSPVFGCPLHEVSP
jgi:hypothetical protein